MSTSPAGPVVLSCALTILAGSAAAQVARVDRVQAEPSGAEITITVVVDAPEGRPVRGLDLLVRLAGEPSEDLSLRAALGDGSAPGDLRRWAKLTTDEEPEQRYLGALDPTPEGAWLHTRTDGAHYIRWAIGDLDAAERRSLTLTVPLPEEPDEPLSASAEVLAHHLPGLTARDFPILPEHGLLGWLVLFRTLLHQRDREDAATALGEVLGTTLGEDEAPAPALAAAVWLLPEIAPDRLVEHAVTVAKNAGGDFDTHLADALAVAKAADPLLHHLFEQSVTPPEGPGSAQLRLLGGAARNLDPAWAAKLILALSALPDERAGVIGRVAGPTAVPGLVSLEAPEALDALRALGRWRAADAVVALVDLDPEALDRLTRFVGGEALTAAARAMIAERTPEEVVFALGSPTPAIRDLAHGLVLAGGEPALQVVTRRLAAMGHLPDREADPNAGDLPRLAARLQGVLLAPLAAPEIYEAESIEPLEGDCLAPLEAARKRLHPQLHLPPELLARCEALRAVQRLSDGHATEAEALIEDVIARAPGDPKVRTRYLTIMHTKARRLLDSGDLDGARSLVQRVDPHLSDRGTLPILADIETRLGEQALAAGDREAARRHFTEAKRLDPSLPTAAVLLTDRTAGMRRLLVSALVILLGVGLLAFGLRWVARLRALRTFRTLSETTPGEFRGAGRRYLVGGQGLLVLRRLGWRLVPWAEVRDAYLVDKRNLLLWHGGADSTLVPASRVDDFSGLVRATEAGLAEVGTSVHYAPPDDPAEAADNRNAMEAVARSEARARLIRHVALGLGGVVAVLLALLDLGAGLGTALQALVALGIGVGLALVTLAAADALLPARA